MSNKNSSNRQLDGKLKKQQAKELKNNKYFELISNVQSKNIFDLENIKQSKEQLMHMILFDLESVKEITSLLKDLVTYSSKLSEKEIEFHQNTINNLFKILDKENISDQERIKIHENIMEISGYVHNSRGDYLKMIGGGLGALAATITAAFILSKSDENNAINDNEDDTFIVDNKDTSL